MLGRGMESTRGEPSPLTCGVLGLDKYLLPLLNHTIDLKIFFRLCLLDCI